MRKLIFIGFIVLGAALGLFSALDGDAGLRMVMTLFGALVGTAIGGAVSRVGGGRRSTLPGAAEIPGLGTSSEDLAANYWRDKGHPPFMKPSSAEPDRHMFDPDRLD